MDKFNKKEYDAQYQREHYKQFKAKIKNKDMSELNDLLKNKGMNKTEFVLNAKDLLERGIMMNENEKIFNEIYRKTGKNVAELISDFEFNYKFNIELEYKGVYKSNDKIIIKVFDDISQCPFELVFNEETNELEIN